LAKGSRDYAERFPFGLDYWTHNGGEHVGPNYGNGTSDSHRIAGEQLAPVPLATKIRKMSGSFLQYAIGNRHGFTIFGLLSAAGIARREAFSTNCPKELGCDQDRGDRCSPDGPTLPCFTS
jgi:hypothetical protein